MIDWIDRGYHLTLYRLIGPLVLNGDDDLDDYHMVDIAMDEYFPRYISWEMSTICSHLCIKLFIYTSYLCFPRWKDNHTDKCECFPLIDWTAPHSINLASLIGPRMMSMMRMRNEYNEIWMMMIVVIISDWILVIKVWPST